MAEFSTQKVGRVTKDIISELPRNVQETILCFLPVEDAVRTSILSKKWRNCWTMMPHLIFDQAFSGRMMDKFGQNDGNKLLAYKFVSVINKTLLLHRGPILKFSLTIPRNNRCDTEIIHDYIDQWIPLLSSKGIKQLTLRDSKLQQVTAHHFSSLDLTHLRLSSVCFPYKPAHGRFTHLTNLYLSNATSNFGQSIFDCPVLEKLTLRMCTGLFYTNFHAPNLKQLHQLYNGNDLEIQFAGLERLTDYLLAWSGTAMEAKTSNVVKVFSILQKIRRFSIALRFMKYLADGGCPKRLSKPLPYLKTLNVRDINLTQLSEVSCLLCMIRSAPNLSKLNIWAEDCCDEVDLKNYCIEDSEDHNTLVHLEFVTFSYFSGLKAELELVRFILAHSPLLKTMFIHRKEGIKEGLALTMTEEILEYPRASTRAQIRHSKRPCIKIKVMI